MPNPLAGRTVLVIGEGTAAHRGVAVALAEAGARVAVAGPAADQGGEARLHSIANEVWAMGRPAAVFVVDPADAASVAGAVARAMTELGPVALVLRCDEVEAA
jgi:NAD(P)-dependent dehydrogenase (short-subunit alcohol dehydrogenase family)